ncbi:MAG: thioredoxin fold domain-containing protein [candidate division WOR-3 bacterium]|nr:MAG: thioredoxin fold domain-containing protein [candidate division WOR-3 bacterium]
MKRLTAFSVAALIVGFLGCGPSEQPALQAPTEVPVEEPAADSAGQTAGSAESDSVAEQQPNAPKPESQEPGPLPKLWDFSAEWCPPCQDQKPIIHELEGELKGKVEVKIIDVDQEKDLASKFNIKAIPTQVFLDKNGNELSRHTGFFSKDSLIGRMTAHGFIN